jgi:hypothetical protein
VITFTQQQYSFDDNEDDKYEYDGSGGDDVYDDYDSLPKINSVRKNISLLSSEITPYRWSQCVLACTGVGICEYIL